MVIQYLVCKYCSYNEFVDRKDFWPDNKYCCVENDNKCNNPGALIIPTSLPGTYHRLGFIIVASFYLQRKE